MGPKGIAFCVVKNQMYAQISEVVTKTLIKKAVKYLKNFLPALSGFC